MAKISANGDREAARWRRGRQPRPEAPYQMVLTAKGRLLYKPCREDGFKLRRRGCSRAQADAQAAMFGMERV